ncbi:hypothetical protein [Salicola sp. Rm-C-2C1-2]|uniref:hypothetical protein n=1 Tax=Salicola sp. Rm-C-2C1-2 TaxID=3141321 RepID=UPI0032E3C644
MAQCQPIEGLKLDDKSRAALERIRKKPQLGKQLGGMISSGIFNSIFTKSRVPQAGFNITQTDWNLYAEAMASIPTIVRQSMKKEINMMFLHYQMPGNRDHKHMQFWRNMRNGCEIR